MSSDFSFLKEIDGRHDFYVNGIQVSKEVASNFDPNLMETMYYTYSYLESQGVVLVIRLKNNTFIKLTVCISDRVAIILNVPLTDFNQLLNDNIDKLTAVDPDFMHRLCVTLTNSISICDNILCDMLNGRNSIKSANRSID